MKSIPDHSTRVIHQVVPAVREINQRFSDKIYVERLSPPMEQSIFQKIMTRHRVNINMS